MTIARLFPMTMLLAAAALAGCTTGGSAPATAGGAAPATAERIAFSVGPCFGFCPVYSAGIGADGMVSFEGERHTAVLGNRTAQRDAARYARFAAALAPFRPATGSHVRTTCDAQATDQSDYHISWTAPDGTQTILDHNRGCRSARNDALNAVLQAAPETLGIAEWTAQATRPGTSRG
jgi:hypothetical protein